MEMGLSETKGREKKKRDKLKRYVKNQIIEVSKTLEVFNH